VGGIRLITFKVEARIASADAVEITERLDGEMLIGAAVALPLLYSHSGSDQIARHVETLAAVNLLTSRPYCFGDAGYVFNIPSIIFERLLDVAMPNDVRHLYKFGGFRLDTNEHLLYRQDGEVVPLKPKVIETLELLVQERGRLIGKDELMTRLWPDTIVEESNLSQNIYLLRKVLGTDEGGRKVMRY